MKLQMGDMQKLGFTYTFCSRFSVSTIRFFPSMILFWDEERGGPVSVMYWLLCLLFSCLRYSQVPAKFKGPSFFQPPTSHLYFCPWCCVPNSRRGWATPGVQLDEGNEVVQRSDEVSEAAGCSNPDLQSPCEAPVHPALIRDKSQNFYHFPNPYII